MAKTVLSIEGENFLVNGQPVYSQIKGTNPDAHGLLMNARFIQGVFDDRNEPERFNRWGRGPYDPDRQTDELIAALPQWYRYGLRAFTVGFQGGGPCFTVPANTIGNNPFGEDGKQIDTAYATRMDRLIRAADEIGMVVIVSYFYVAHIGKLADEDAVREAVKTASRFLVDGGYKNVIIEIANEHDLLRDRMVAATPEGMASLIQIAQKEVGGTIPVGSSGTGGYATKEVCEASDVLIIHGNHCTRQQFSNLISHARKLSPGKPVLCNEDSQAIGNMGVGYRKHVSWGYYNNMTKQEPPTDWSITPGEDTFFALRMARGLGLTTPEVPFDQRFYLQGLEPHGEYEGKRWLKLASMYPEAVDYVDFYRNGELVDTTYDEPFSLFFNSNWHQRPWEVKPDDREWKAEVHLCDGTVVEKVATREGDAWVQDEPFRLS